MDARDLALLQARGRIALGAAMLAAPGLVRRSWIGGDAGRRATKVIIRGLGGRDLALGLGVAIALDHGAPVRGWLEGTALADLADLVGTLLAGSSIPAGARRVVAALAGGSAAAAFALARALDEPAEPLRAPRGGAHRALCVRARPGG